MPARVQGQPRASDTACTSLTCSGFWMRAAGPAQLLRALPRPSAHQYPHAASCSGREAPPLTVPWCHRPFRTTLSVNETDYKSSRGPREPSRCPEGLRLSLPTEVKTGRKPPTEDTPPRSSTVLQTPRSLLDTTPLLNPLLPETELLVVTRFMGEETEAQRGEAT